MIGSVTPCVAQLGHHPQRDRLDGPAGEPAVAVGQPRRAGARVEPQRLHRVDRRERGHARPRRLAGVAQVVVVGRELEDHRVVAAGHRLVEHVLEDRREVEVHVVAAHVELHGGDVARGHRGVHPVHERHELLGGEAAQRDDRALVPGVRVVVGEVGVDADVAPAERVDPPTVGAAQHPPVAAQQAGQLARGPVLAGGEVALAGLHRERAGGHGAELGEREEQRHRAHPVEAGGAHAVAEQAGGGHQPVAEHDVAEAHLVPLPWSHGHDATGAALSGPRRRAGRARGGCPPRPVARPPPGWPAPAGSRRR